MFPFNIMAKPVGGLCNLDCTYCYYKSKPLELYPHAPGPIMSEATLEDFTRQYLQAMPVRCEFSWQGGEPTLAGLDFYRRALSLQKQFCLPGQAVVNGLQTNGTLLDDPWCEFLAGNDVLVGVSIDGPARPHDLFRRDKNGQGTWHLAWAGLERLRKHHTEVNVLATLNSANVSQGGDLYRYFVNRGLRYLQFIPILERAADGAIAEFSCDGPRWGRFMLEVFEQWLSRDVGQVSERFIDHVLHVLVHGQAAMCCHAPRCANAFVLEWNGDLYACDHFVATPWRLGNITQTPLAELVQSPVLERFSALKTSLSEACRDCEFLTYCNAGCPKHHVCSGSAGRFFDPPGVARMNHFCEGYKMFFRRALPDLKRIAQDIVARS